MKPLLDSWQACIREYGEVKARVPHYVPHNLKCYTVDVGLSLTTGRLSSCRVTTSRDYLQSVDFMGSLYYRGLPMTAREAKRTLTPELFGRCLRWLSSNDELAVREYQAIRSKLVRYFTHKGCADPDELFDETVDIVIRKIETCAEFPAPLAYCYGVARN